VAKSLIATRFTGTLAAAKGRQQRKALRLAAVLAAANLYSDYPNNFASRGGFWGLIRASAT
jgi:hypothetical protein